MCGGSTSGMPPTFVLTQSNPQEAASRIAMQNASVNDGLRNICPRQRTFLTSECGKDPRSSTLSEMLYLSLISFKIFILGPSPPIIKCTFGYFLKISGITSTSRSTPFLSVNLQIETIFIVFLGFLSAGSGVKELTSTELGMT